MKYQYIIAGNYDQYCTWAADKMSVNNCRYVSSINVLRGIRDPHGVFIGTWYERKDIYDILLILLTASSVENTEIRKAIKYYEDKRYERTN